MTAVIDPHDHIPLSPERLPPPVVERLQQALVMPMGEGPNCPCGVFRADGRFHGLSRTLLSGDRLSTMPEPGGMPLAETIPGRWLFAGIGRHHFGHFLVETLGRLWAVGLYRKELDGIVIVPKRGIDLAAALDGGYGRLLALLTDSLPVHLVRHPTRFQTLLLPSPGFGHRRWITGTEIFREEIRTRIERRIAPDGPERLYISRSRLGRGARQMDDEPRIEALLREAGYTIFHPQEHSIEKQLARYRAATMLVGGDGSAFHLAAFAMPRGARVGLILRRHSERAFKVLIAQMEAFAEARVHPIRAVLPEARSDGRGGARADDDAALDFAVIARELSDAGLI